MAGRAGHDPPGGPVTTLATVVSLALFGVAGGIALIIAGVHAGRELRRRRWARRSQVPRRALLAFAASGDRAELAELADLPAAAWRTVAPTAFQLLTKVRGEAHAALADLLNQRGLVRAARRDLRRWGAVRRARAAAVLGSLADRRSVPALCDLLTDRHPEVRVAAVHALGRIGDPAAAGPLLASLAPGRSTPSQLVANALAQLGPGVTASLREALAGAALVRTTALDALWLIGPAAVEAEPPAAYPAVGAGPDLGAGGDDVAADSVAVLVAKVLRVDPSLAVRQRAARTLGRLGSHSAVRALLAGARPGEPGVLRVSAVKALGELGALAAVRPLTALLSVEDDQVAAAAARALTRLGPTGLAALAEVTAGAASEALVVFPGRGGTAAVVRAGVHARAVLARVALTGRSVPAAPVEVASS